MSAQPPLALYALLLVLLPVDCSRVLCRVLLGSNMVLLITSNVRYALINNMHANYVGWVHKALLPWWAHYPQTSDSIMTCNTHQYARMAAGMVAPGSAQR